MSAGPEDGADRPRRTAGAPRRTADALRRTAVAPRRTAIDLPLAGGGRLRLDGCGVMGILNVTPDSFSDGGDLLEEGQVAPEAVVRRARAMLAAGARALDLGGESTRPGHEPVTAGDEAERVVPAVEAVRDALPHAVLSVDTQKPAVARAALDAGAHLLNDVSGGRDPGMLAAAREAGCAIVLMRRDDLSAKDLVGSCGRQMEAIRQRALDAGLAPDQVVMDPGLGFGDPPGGDVAANLRLVDRLQELAPTPTLVGASRKRFVGRASGVEAPRERVAGSVAVACLAARRGAALVRVHDVAPTVQALRVLGAVP